MSTPTPRRTRRWIEDWRPEDADFWEGGGRAVARRNLVWSIFAEHVGFSVWLIWSVSSAFLLAQGFAFTPQQLFLLVALPNLVGSLMQLLLPVMVGGAGIFGLVQASSGGIHLERAAYAYAGLALLATAAAWLWMDNLATVTSSPREQMQVVKQRRTWQLSLLYIGTFGSFIGYSAAMPLLIRLNFWVPEPAPLGTGIYFAFYAFLGAGVGSLTRP